MQRSRSDLCAGGGGSGLRPNAAHAQAEPSYFGPTSPGGGKNWLKTVPGQGFFVNFRLYAPTKPFFDQT
jgi:hypothetical protein